MASPAKPAPAATTAAAAPAAGKEKEKEKEPDPPASEARIERKEVNVSAGKMANKVIKLERGQRVEWEFKTAAYDIAFAAQFTRTDVNPPATEEVFTLTRLSSVDKVAVLGSFVAHHSGDLKITFDNTHSNWRSKTVSFKMILYHTTAAKSHFPIGTPVVTPYGNGAVIGYRAADSMYRIQLPYAVGFMPASTLSITISAAASVNERAIYGTDLFFNNRFAEAEAFFERDMHQYPVFALAYGAIGFVRAMMTWEKPAMKEAADRMLYSRELAAACTPVESTFGWLVGSKATPMNRVQMEMTLIMAECSTLGAIMMLTDENFMSFVKSGLSLRSGWKLYEKCYAQLNTPAAAAPAPAKAGAPAAAVAAAPLATVADRSVRGGIGFGIGAFNTFISLMPPIVLRIVSALGFPSDRTRGLDELNKTLDGGGLRSPLAALILLNVHIVIPSFFSVRLASHLAEGERVLDKVLERYPEGALFWWMAGRMKRMKRDPKAAALAFERSARAQKEWIQLQHLCAYELGWCAFFDLDFGRAEHHFERLAKENAWSKAFYTYMQAVVLMETGRDAEARKLCAGVADAITRKYGGKILSLEQFVLRRAAAFAKDARMRPLLPGLEMVYLFFGIPSMANDLLLRANAIIDTKIAEHAVNLKKFTAAESSLSAPYAEQVQNAKLMKCAIMKALHRYDEAEQLGVALANLESVLTHETYVSPFAMFELASMYMNPEILTKGVPPTAAASGDAKSNTAAATVSAADSKSAPASAAVPAPVLSAVESMNLYMTDANESKMYANFKSAEANFKRAKKYSADFNFKMRLHFRVHLALDELNWMKTEWKDKKIRDAKAKGIAVQLPSALDTKSDPKDDDDEAGTQIEGMDIAKISAMRAELEKEESKKEAAAAAAAAAKS